MAARKSAVSTPDEVVEENVSVIEDKPLSMDEKVTLRNLAGWMVGFNKLETVGQVNIDAKGVARISRGEVVAQAENGNRLIAGLDGMGSHASILIDDKATRRYLGFEDDNREQKIISEKLLKEIFEEKDEETFKSRISDLIKTRHEREAVKDIISKNNLEDNTSYSRIKFVKDLCRVRF